MSNRNTIKCRYDCAAPINAKTTSSHIQSKCFVSHIRVKLAAIGIAIALSEISIEEVAEKLYITSGTVQDHLGVIYAKFLITKGKHKLIPLRKKLQAAFKQYESKTFIPQPTEPPISIDRPPAPNSIDRGLIGWTLEEKTILEYPQRIQRIWLSEDAIDGALQPEQGDLVAAIGAVVERFGG